MLGAFWKICPNLISDVRDQITETYGNKLEDGVYLKILKLLRLEKLI